MASSREIGLRGLRALLGGVLAGAVLVSAAQACSVGHGEGDLTGSVQVVGCLSTGQYDLIPTAFLAQTVEDLLRIRVQRGSDLEVRSDGLAVLVEEASVVKRDHLGEALSLLPDSKPRIDVSVYLNESCPPGRTRTPVVLGAVSGTIRFDKIYAPAVSPSEVGISATLTNVRFEGLHRDERWAELSGSFDFLYVRGSPAQRFP